jgi:hypothetical protein
MTRTTHLALGLAGLLLPLACDDATGRDAPSGDALDTLLRTADAAVDDAIAGEVPFAANDAFDGCADTYAGCIDAADETACVPDEDACVPDGDAIEALTQCYLDAQTDAEFDACALLEEGLLDDIDGCVEGAVGGVDACLDAIDTALTDCDDALDACLDGALDTMCADFEQQCVDLGGGAICDGLCDAIDGP